MKRMASVSQETLAKRIGEILQGADLSQLSSKKVRKQLEEEYSVDLTEQKKEVDNLVLSILKEITTENSNAQQQQQQPHNESSNSHSESNGKESKENGSVDEKPKKVSKPKSSSSSKAESEDTRNCEQKKKATNDEELAKKLRREDFNFRSRRSASKTGKSTPKKDKKRDQKSKKKAKSENGAENGGSDEEGGSPKKKKKTGLDAPVVVSPALAEVIRVNEVSRPQVVKKIWEYIKQNNLQDPENKQNIICDDKLQAVFGKPKIHMFTMNKVLSQHLKRKDEII